jgi:hypothetical protein
MQPGDEYPEDLESWPFCLMYNAWPVMEGAIRTRRTEKGLPEVPEGQSDIDIGAGLNEADRQLIGARFGSALEADLAPVAGPLGVRVDHSGPDIRVEGYEVGICGPGVPDLVAMFAPALDLAATVVVLAQFADVVKAIARRLKELTEDSVYLNEGTAAIVAAKAVCDQTGEFDLTVAFSTAITGAISPEDGSGGRPDGFAVGFRGDASLRIVLMDLTGERIVVRLLPMTWVGRDSAS